MVTDHTAPRYVKPCGRRGDKLSDIGKGLQTMISADARSCIRAVNKLYMCASRMEGMLRAGQTCLYILHTLRYHRLATLLALPVPLVSRGKGQTSRQASTLVRTLAVYS